MKEYSVNGTITFEVDLDIKANSEEEAIELAKEQLLDFYSLNCHGADHDPNEVKLDLDAIEYEDEEYEGLCVCIEPYKDYIVGEKYDYYRHFHDYYVDDPDEDIDKRNKMDEGKFLWIFKNVAELREDRINSIIE